MFEKFNVRNKKMLMNPTNASILLSLEGPVATICFNRPSALNALDQVMAGRFLAACQSIRAAHDVRVVVIKGEGRAFMAGGDLAGFHANISAAVQTANALIDPLHEALAILAELSQPVIASLHGAVAGAGVSVALACDLAIAADDVKFNLAYARIGTSPDAAGSWSLPRIVGLRKAMEMMLLADNFDGAEALRLGIINRIVPPSALSDQTRELAQRIAKGPTFAYGQTKRLLRSSFGHSQREQMDAERAAFCACASTGDFAEGLEAFFNKRKPEFTGA